jgi:N-acetylmuramoyl-L-alanine amidase
MRKSIGLALAMSVLALLATSADWRTPPPGEGPDTAPVHDVEGRPCIAVDDLARLLDATKFWRADVRRLVLRSGPHTVVLTADNPFVVVDERTLWLGAPVRSRGGELQVPVTLVDSLPSDSALARLTYDARRARIVVLPTSGRVESPRWTVQGDVTRIVFPADHAEEALVVARARAHFRLRFGGIFFGDLPESGPPGSRVLAMRSIATAGGSAFECAIAREATGYRLIQDPPRRRVTLEISTGAAEGFEAFAPESPPGERHLKVVVIDPGHGGSDTGVISGEAVEKDLTLSLAKLVAAEIAKSGVRAVLTRSDDRDLSPEERAEIANRLSADLVLAIHFDGFVDPHARGATAYCPPAAVGEPERLAEAGRAERADASAAATAPGRVVLLPWRDVAMRHAVQSRAFAEALLSALELSGQGPTRLRERLPYDLLGVNAPGVVLECATLTAQDDRERVMQEEGLRQLAASISDAVGAYRRNQ